MSIISDYKKRLIHGGSTVGQHHKYNSDMIVENTWYNDLQSQECYIYDAFHDDQSEYNSGYDPIQSKTKIPIDAKFIKSQKQTLAKDMIDYQLQFRPSQKVSNFNESDELYYYEKDFTKRYGAEFPVGLYVDIQDDQGVYHKWLICQKEYGTQFIKYIILPCNYRFTWVSSENGNRVIRRMWGVSRNQLSYNSGVYRDDKSEHIENQDKCWMPMNFITSKLFYTNDDNNNLRLVVSAAVERPIVWRISKVENHAPFGLQKLTIYQSQWNDSTDYIDWDAINRGDIYAMYADYFQGTIPINSTQSNSETPILITCTILASSNTIKVGGSYKTLTATFTDFGDTDITEELLLSITPSWTAEIDGKDITDNKNLITWRAQDKTNVIKIKFDKNMDCLGKTLVIKCTANYEGNNIVGVIELKIVNT